MPTCVIDVAFSLPCRSKIQIVRSLHSHSRRGVSNECSKVFLLMQVKGMQSWYQDLICCALLYAARTVKGLRTTRNRTLSFGNSACGVELR